MKLVHMLEASVYCPSVISVARAQHKSHFLAIFNKVYDQIYMDHFGSEAHMTTYMSIYMVHGFGLSIKEVRPTQMDHLLWCSFNVTLLLTYLSMWYYFENKHNNKDKFSKATQQSIVCLCDTSLLCCMCLSSWVNIC